MLSILEDKKLDFLTNSINPNLFIIEDVANDNACFYRAFSNVINNYLSTLDNLKNYDCFKNLKRIYGNKDLNYSLENQDKLAKFFQQTSCKWIKNNYHLYLEEYGMNLETMIELTHEIDIYIYLERYKYFAGDTIINKFDSGKIYKNGKNKGETIFVTKELEDRWGSTVEQIALSETYKITIIILSSQNLLNNKIITGKITNNKAEKGVIFKVMQIIGKKYLIEKQPIFLLWKKKKMKDIIWLFI